MKSKVFSVTQINTYIKRMFQSDYALRRISIKGQVSNCKYHSSGHIYFSLKDEESQISCVMFASARYNGLQFELEDGQEVIVDGNVSVYERGGSYQLYAQEIRLNGIGELYVALYNGREISFISEKTHDLLKKVSEKMTIIPTSTRTEEQYKRIDLDIGIVPYALVCNGGVLLVNGKRDREWYLESLQMIRNSKPEMEKAQQILAGDSRRKFELRFLDELFIFTKCEKPEEVVKDLQAKLTTKLVDVFHNGEKVYVVPVNLSKGMAVRRLRKRLQPAYIIAAGDSEFDVSMVEESDLGLVPAGFKKIYGNGSGRFKETVMEMEAGRLFSETLLEKCLVLYFKEPD